ncbi:phosphoenolpyruvate synthase [Persicimonas caeni]|uniref:Phosphoenolpyruvate synthase n=1 Tax=Persicimonas caeni TaxID=2292766 RepID=A0A4Y6PQ25_PERCE|nr:phosphoenolpyruvate synthase [Persicimonas caeni]QDG50424.1 phosphoenolpyruvate synthase [Persicimonas caeni]QED31645.1 phosphoenolpyruvate synthase [Persicimonas caeni]
MTELIGWFEDIGIEDVPKVGGKNASLGEMYRELVPEGVAVPPGFAVTADAYRYFLEETGVGERIYEILEGLDTHDIAELRKRGQKIRHTITRAEFPKDLQQAIVDAYDQLSEEAGFELDVAVRSSATAEDLPESSFAGQQESYLNVQGHAALLHTCKLCYASLFTDRAISYRVDRGFDHRQVALSVGVQQMVRSDLASAGVAFSIDTESGFEDAVFINASYGLGESVVKGTVNPDEYYVFKPTLKEGFEPILEKNLGSKEFKLVYAQGGTRSTRPVPVGRHDRQRYALSDEDILIVARWVAIIEDHYTEKAGKPMPMDVEWAKDGRTGELFIVQARPETVQSQKRRDVLETYRLTGDEGPGEALVTGRAIGAKIVSGPVQLVSSIEEIEEFEEGSILVTSTTDPDWEPIMKKAAAIVTDRGGRTSHAAIVSREMGVPAIVGTIDGSQRLEDGRTVTISCAEGEEGKVYDGQLKYEVETVDLRGLERPETKIMMNVANPSEAFRLSRIPNDGVGLAREEFIINSFIGIHPLALLNFDAIEDEELKDEIAQRTVQYEDKAEFFVDRLAQGIAMIGAGFYPNDVIVRLSDFKSNEYAALLGGELFEPTENNPMLGFRGASRYYDERYKDAFALECRALKKVRDEMGLRNVKVMVPFCRTVEEGRKVQEVMAEHGLKRGENGLEIYVMCEIPSNVILAEKFAEIFDGFSIGSNDLTQLTLGVDRDSEIIAHLFDERDEAVKEMVHEVIERAHKHGRKVGICGQAPSDYPEFARFLVDEGIDSISLNPDVVLKTTLDILEAEKG